MPNPVKVIVTCGPSYEPIDEVRRITNFSTGELGAILAHTLAAAGCDVICLRGVTATHPAALNGVRVQPFTTNDDLAAQLQDLSRHDETAAIFHAAALCDYRVRRIADSAGEVMRTAKIASRAGALTIELEMAAKLISRLREMFPHSLIVGWKYDLDGTRADALANGQRQLAESHTDACVVNGRAYGNGFGFLQPSGDLQHIADKQQLCSFLAAWLARERGNGVPQNVPATNRAMNTVHSSAPKVLRMLI